MIFSYYVVIVTRPRAYMGYVRTRSVFVTPEQKAYWLRLEGKELTKMFDFLMNTIGLSATKAATFCTADHETQDAMARQILAIVSEKDGVGNMWEAVYDRQSAIEQIPMALYKTYLACW